jgi:hypothetical protein
VNISLSQFSPRRLKCIGMKGAVNKESDVGGDYQLEEKSI